MATIFRPPLIFRWARRRDLVAITSQPNQVALVLRPSVFSDSVTEAATAADVTDATVVTSSRPFPTVEETPPRRRKDLAYAAITSQPGSSPQVLLTTRPFPTVEETPQRRRRDLTYPAITSQPGSSPQVLLTVKSADIAEAASAVDVVASVVTFAAAITEAASAVDVTDATQTFRPTPTSEQTLPQPKRNLNFPAETAQLLGSPDALLHLFSDSVTEAASATDVVAAQGVFAATITEAASAVDATDATQSFRPQPTQEQTLPQPKRNLEFPAVVAQLLGSPAALLHILQDSITETVSAADTVAATAVFAADVAEAASAVDTSVADGTGRPSPGQEQTLPNPRPNRRLPAITAQVLGSPVVLLHIYNDAIAESASAVDTVAVLATFAAAISETASAVDTTDATQSFRPQPTEEQTLPQPKRNIKFPSLTSQLLGSPTTLLHIWSDSIVEAASAADVVAATLTFASDIAETASAADVVSTVVAFAAAVTEAATAADTTDATTILRLVSTNEQTLPQPRRNLRVPAITSQALGSPSVLFHILSSAITEVANAVDAVSATVVFAAAVAEAAAAADTNAAAATVNASIVENLTILDADDAALVTTAPIIEAMVSVDVMSASVGAAAIARITVTIKLDTEASTSTSIQTGTTTSKSVQTSATTTLTVPDEM